MGLTANYDASGNQISDITPTLHTSQLLERHAAEHAEMGVNSDWADIPVLLIGGDHPFLQWFGTDGSNGLAQMYADVGIKPYCAINTGPLDTYIETPTNYMSYPQMLTIADKVEFVAHGHRHPLDWRLVNTGIIVRYTGSATTATVAITVSTITGATDGAVDDFSFDITTAPYDTIAELVAAIDALPNWTASYASELLGTELSTNLMLRAATSAKTSLYLAAGGGILLTNQTTTYRQITVNSNGTVLAMYGDGVRLLNLTLSGNTLTQVVAAINAITGLKAELTNDAERGENNYLSGAEDATCLAKYKWTGRRNVTQDGCYLHSGLSHWYIVERQLVQCKQTAAANGLTLTNFAQSGDKFYAKNAFEHNTYGLYRGNNKTGAVIYPNAFIRNSNFIQHVGIDQTNYPTPANAGFAAILEALIDSPGFTVCLLLHNLYADGTTGYTFPNGHPADWGAMEAEWATFLASIKVAQTAGKIKTMTFEQYRRRQISPLSQVSNLLFNPRLKNSGGSMLVATADPGLKVPGWRLGTLSASTSAASIDSNGFLSATTSAAINSLQQMVSLEPGTYEFSAQVPELTYTSISGILLKISSYTPDYFTTKGLPPGITIYDTTYALRGPGEISLRFSITPPAHVPAKVISKNSQTYNLGTNKNIRIQVDGKTITADIDCSAGAGDSAACTAKEVAAAINSGMAANAATYAAEYHNIAKAVNGKVVLEAPYITGDVTGAIYVSDGTTASARTAIFGDECYGVSMLADYDHLGGTIPVTVGVEQNMVGTAKIGAFCLRKVTT